MVDNSAQEWIDQTDYNYNLLDAQISTTETVCIDHDATAFDSPGQEHYGPETALLHGSLECLDEPDWVFRYDSYIFLNVPNLNVKNTLVIITF